MERWRAMVSDLDLTVRIAGLTLPNPVMVASGTFGYGEEYAPFMAVRRLGAVVVKGLSLRPRVGNPPPRLVETPAGILNAIGLENVGVEAFKVEKLPVLRDLGVPIVVNIFGETADEFREIARCLEKADGVSALEANISCPNVARGGMVFGTDPRMTAEVVSSVRSVTSLPLVVKLTPNVTDVTEIARSAEGEGADAISLINTLLGMAVDVESRQPALGNITGGLSGPAIRPVAVRMVWQVAQVVKVPVIGVGGIATAEDALEFIIAGASAVQVGTATFAVPDASVRVLEGIEAYCREHNVRRLTDLVGSLRVDEPAEGGSCRASS